MSDKFDKLPQDAVDYGIGHERSHCGPLPQWSSGSCRFFSAPDRCELVAGRIERDKWCSKWTGRKAKVGDA